MQGMQGDILENQHQHNENIDPYGVKGIRPHRREGIQNVTGNDRPDPHGGRLDHKDQRRQGQIQVLPRKEAPQRGNP